MQVQIPRTRRVQRVHLPHPLLAKLGSAQVVLVDISTLGARIEHHTNLHAGAHSRLRFMWDERELVIECRIVRSRIERFSTGTDGLTVYHSGLEFEAIDAETKATLKAMIGIFISRALEEQKLNARGAVPEHHVDKMPIFRSGQLTANAKDKQVAAPPVHPAARLAKESSYVCHHLENQRWRQKKTQDPGQPDEGFTVSAAEDHTQVELLRQAYEKSDFDGRKMIQLCAQLSILEGEGLGAAISA